MESYTHGYTCQRLYVVVAIPSHTHILFVKYILYEMITREKSSI